MGLFWGPLGKKLLESWASFLDPYAFLNDFLKTQKMCNVCTIILAEVSRQDLYYVSENESFCFGQNFWISRFPDFPNFAWAGPGLDLGGGGEMLASHDTNEVRHDPCLLHASPAPACLHALRLS